MLIYLLLGCNVGNCEETFTQAKSELNKMVGEIKKTSSLYVTDAWGNTNQNKFLNQAIVCDTNFSPAECLTKILSIENKLGRTRKEKWEPRNIDIDILLIDSEMIDTIDLQVPHPFLHQRKFALAPLAEINENLIHPILKKSIKSLLTELENDTLNVNILTK